ncbi:hypothetical protein NB693_23200 [Pantoea ananatis]|nr:hypothetical protein [Pantoea ananatis]
MDGIELVKHTNATPSSIRPRKIRPSLPVLINRRHGTASTSSAMHAPITIGLRPRRSLNRPPTTLSGIITSITRMISSNPLLSA